MLDKDITGRSITIPSKVIPVSMRRISSLSVDFNTGNMYIQVDYGDPDGAGGIKVKKTRRFRFLSGVVVDTNITPDLGQAVLAAVTNAVDMIEEDPTLVDGSGVFEL